MVYFIIHSVYYIFTVYFDFEVFNTFLIKIAKKLMVQATLGLGKEPGGSHYSRQFL